MVVKNKLDISGGYTMRSIILYIGLIFITIGLTGIYNYFRFYYKNPAISKEQSKNIVWILYGSIISICTGVLFVFGGNYMMTSTNKNDNKILNNYGNYLLETESYDWSKYIFIGSLIVITVIIGGLIYFYKVINKKNIQSIVSPSSNQVKYSNTRIILTVFLSFCIGVLLLYIGYYLYKVQSKIQ